MIRLRYNIEKNYVNIKRKLLPSASSQPQQELHCRQVIHENE